MTERISVVVTTYSGEKLYGYLPEGKTREYMGFDVVQLNDVRSLVIQRSAKTDSTGHVVGLQSMEVLIPIDVATDVMNVVHVRPSSWWFVNDHEALGPKMKKLVKLAEGNELKARAAEAGIQV